jgi:ribosomal protein L25 (general stress protein Ctc)
LLFLFFLYLIMKIKSKEVKECEFTNSKKTTVLDLIYTHRWQEWRILVKDFQENDYKNILKQLRVKVRENFNKLKSEA